MFFGAFRYVPNVGMFDSQCGNISFPTWEQKEYPDRESNSELSFRRALLYPFNYQGKVLFDCKDKAFFAESQTNIQ